MDETEENEENGDLMEQELDNNWIKEFELQDKNYESFYKEDINYINFNFIYVNKNNDIEKIKEEKIFMKTPNYISREEIIGILKKNNSLDNKKYIVLSIVKYNIDLEPSDVSFFLKPNKNPDPDFLTNIQNIDAIPLVKSISMFQDLNDIFIIFSESIEKKGKSNNRRSKNSTKRNYIGHINAHKKTIRNIA